jgi:ATP synthase protein I
MNSVPGPRRSSQRWDGIGIILLGQGIVSVGLAGLLWVWLGQTAASSVFLGGMTALIPNAFLAARLMRAGTGEEGRALLRAAWLGETGKVILTALLFAVIFARVRPLEPLAVFGGYICAHLVIFGALLLDSGAKDMATTKY